MKTRNNYLTNQLLGLLTNQEIQKGEICENTSYSFESKECMVASIINNNIKDVMKQRAVDWLQKSFSNEQDQYYKYIAFYSYKDPMKEAKNSLLKYLSR